MAQVVCVKHVNLAEIDQTFGGNLKMGRKLLWFNIVLNKDTLLATNISLTNAHKCTFEDDFPFPQVGYVYSLEGRILANVAQVK